MITGQASRLSTFFRNPFENGCNLHFVI